MTIFDSVPILDKKTVQNVSLRLRHSELRVIAFTTRHIRLISSQNKSKIFIRGSLTTWLDGLRLIAYYIDSNLCPFCAKKEMLVLVLEGKIPISDSSSELVSMEKRYDLLQTPPTVKLQNIHHLHLLSTTSKKKHWHLYSWI